MRGTAEAREKTVANESLRGDARPKAVAMVLAVQGARISRSLGVDKQEGKERAEKNAKLLLRASVFILDSCLYHAGRRRVNNILA